MHIELSRVQTSCATVGPSLSHAVALSIVAIMVPLLYFSLRVKEVEDHRLYGLLLLRMTHLIELAVLISGCWRK